MTSFDPLRIYLYEDGLVRIATEEYSEEDEKITDCCVHVTNFAVNYKNQDKFVYNETPSECHGNKVVLTFYIKWKICQVASSPQVYYNTFCVSVDTEKSLEILSAVTI